MIKNKSIRFNFPVFIIVFSLGLLYVYLFTPQKQVMVKYPTPFNANSIIYHDKTNNCFKYNSTKVECPSDKSKIKEHPVL
jgi:hypothetical protein